MSDDRNSKPDSGNENNSASDKETSNRQHPNNPFKEPVSTTNETAKETAENEQKYKEALTERD